MTMYKLKITATDIVFLQKHHYHGYNLRQKYKRPLHQKRQIAPHGEMDGFCHYLGHKFPDAQPLEHYQIQYEPATEINLANADS